MTKLQFTFLYTVVRNLSYHLYLKTVRELARLEVFRGEDYVRTIRGIREQHFLLLLHPKTSRRATAA